MAQQSDDTRSRHLRKVVEAGYVWELDPDGSEPEVDEVPVEAFGPGVVIEVVVDDASVAG